MLQLRSRLHIPVVTFAAVLRHQHADLVRLVAMTRGEIIVRALRVLARGVHACHQRGLPGCRTGAFPVRLVEHIVVLLAGFPLRHITFAFAFQCAVAGHTARSILDGTLGTFAEG